MVLVAERPNNNHSSFVFIRDGLKVNNISVYEEENVVELFTVELPCVVVHSVYKPPHKPFDFLYWDNEKVPHRNAQDILTATVHSGDTPQQTAMENLWSHGRTQIACHSYSPRNYRNHSTFKHFRYV